MSSPFTQSYRELYRRFCQALENILPTDPSSVLIAYSGGADSTLLLDLFARLAQEKNILLRALHFNHKIRAESDEDADFCQKICQKYQIPLEIVVKDVPAYAQAHKLGVEEAARILRYEALEASRKKHEFDCIATAHNATDNTETVLFHLARGSALRGVSGIPPKRERIVRPLLSFSKKEILDCVTENRLPYREDATNADRRYTRNFIRHEILPGLESLNPALHNAVYRFSQNAREDDEALNALAMTHVNCNDTAVLSALPNAILRRVLLIKYRQIAHNEIRNEHLSLACEKIKLAAEKRFTGGITFPGNQILSITIRETAFYPDALIPVKTPILLTPDSAFIFQNAYRITVTENTPAEHPLYSLTVPREAIGFITVRSRQNGDRYRQGSMTRNIKKMLCDKKIPQAHRDALPVILYRNEILFVTHLPVSDLYQRLSTAKEETYRISIYQV